MKPKIHHKLLNFIGFIILLNVVFNPPVVHKKFNIKEGEIATFDVIAPYDFSIPKSPEELAEEREEIAQRISPVFDKDHTIIKTINKKLENLEQLIDSLINLAPQESLVLLIQREYAVPKNLILALTRNNYRSILRKIGRSLTDLYNWGIVDKKSPAFRIITVLSGTKESVTTIDDFYSLPEAESIAGVGVKKDYRPLVKLLLQPNVTYNEIKTRARIDEVFANRPKTKGKILKGELIVEKHKRVHKETIEKLAALEKTYPSGGIGEIVKTLIFRNLFYLAIIFLLFHFSRINSIEIFDLKNLYFISLLSAIFLIFGKITYETNTMYLLPISFFIFLFALFFNFHVAIIFAISYAAIFGVVLNSFSNFVYLLTSGLVAGFSSQTLRTRLSLYKPLLYGALTNVCAILFIEIYLRKSGINFVYLSAGVLNSVISSVSVALFLPLFERLFDFTTDLTLLELGNLNLPIFKEMSLNAPGTFHHSIVVGNLAEAGASAIAADPVFARVGAYYHDIGKLKKPEYFIENQVGLRNPHDILKPQMSALVIISHAKDGIELAKRLKLPKKLIDIIAQHHGTTKVELFYRKALHLSPDISEESFSYPGPKPKTKEAALVMLADAIEASVRAEKNITVTKLQKITKENFDKKFNEGQLDECPINRQDLAKIRAAFLPILSGVFHPRLETDDSFKKPLEP